MKKSWPLILSSIIIVLLTCVLINNYKPYFYETEQAYVSGNAICLQKGIDKHKLAEILVRNDYTTDNEEANYIASVIFDKLERGQTLENINNLKKRAWQIKVNDSLPLFMRNREHSVRGSLQHDILSNDSISKTYTAGSGNGRIVVTVINSNNNKNAISKLFRLDRTPVEGTWVVLTNHTTIDNVRTDSIVGLAKTDRDGVAVFDGLDPTQYYSVLPIDSVMEFGSPKGTVTEPLNRTRGVKNDKLEIQFTADTLSLRLVNDNTLRQIRDDKRITVRTPQQYRQSLYSNIFIVIALFWLLALLIYRRNNTANMTLLSILMLITGIGVVNMYSLADPLVDTLLGAHNTRGIIIGLVIACLVVCVDIVKFYQDRLPVKFDIFLHGLRWLTLPYRQKIAPLARAVASQHTNLILKILYSILLFISLPLIVLNILCWSTRFVDRMISSLPKGTGYLFAAIILTALLFTPLGADVGGMRVNLNLGIPVQPSEVAKYLMVIFMAAFFCEKAPMIISYSRSSNLRGVMFTNKLRLMAWTLIGIGVLMGLYLILSDMGPALVILVTFVLFYSMVKSTVAININDNQEKRLKKILSCDFAIMTYGVISFMLFVWAGKLMGGENMELVAGICWFPCWIILFYLKKQIQESAIMLNAILALFLFGGTILGACGFENEAERFDDRMEMSNNTWGIIQGYSGPVSDPTSNSQVANGLWGLASGGMTGQGIGNGMPQYIPAFNTDMVLISFAENMGFVSVLLVLVLYAVLLWQTIKVGYQAKHRFAFYLSLGIAIVTGVQLLTIVMGALGLIPLTGITVPLMSYGMASMLMNLFAFGLVLSILAHTNASTLSEQAREELKKDINKYNYPVALLSTVGMVLFAIVIVTLFGYMVWNREDVMVRPVFAKSQNGRNVVDYNPRLLALADKMQMGNIYDRNGLLLATHDKSLIKDHDVYTYCGIQPDTLRRLRRYYPFGEHLFFMIGDYNTKLLWNYDENNPIGYLAENQHLSELRGYDNRYRVDHNGRPVKAKFGGKPYQRVYIQSDEVRQERFTPSVPVTDSIYLRDYSALVPYLKDGYNGDKIKRFNQRSESSFIIDKIEPKDITLTVDAKLQTVLQKYMAEYIQDKFSDPSFNKVRASVVILDANKGDLMASANYPLVNYDTITNWLENQKQGYERKYYTDNNRPSAWRAFTDRDLGLTYQTAPGSTAKVMSSLAYYRKHPGQEAPQYYIHPSEIIFRGEGAVSGRIVNISDALRYSSNSYFVNLVNDQELYPQLADIYGNAGVRVNEKIPYTFSYTTPVSEWTHNVTDVAERCIKAYRNYKSSGKKEKMNNRTGKPFEWSWAWGQNGVEASPLTMARIISTVANSGRMPITRYTTDDPIMSTDIITSQDAQTISKYLHRTAKEHDNFGHRAEYLGGKTGTPERVWNSATGSQRIINDGWYICFVETNNTSGTMPKTLAIAVRFERINDGMSGRAVALTKEVVLNVLENLDYIKQ